MNKNAKGSALLWAVCALLVLTLLVTGILALCKRYAQEEIVTVSENQAAYCARSGIALTADAIEQKGAASDFMPEAGKTRSAQFDLDGTVCTVVIDRTMRETVLSLSATAAVGGRTATIYGRLLRQDENWKFMGYTVS